MTKILNYDIGLYIVFRLSGCKEILTTQIYSNIVDVLGSDLR